VQRGEIVRHSNARPAVVLLASASLWACAGPGAATGPAAPAADPAIVEAEIRALLPDAPMAAHVLIARHRQTLAPTTLATLRGEIEASGQTRCAAMAPLDPAAAPYLARMAAAYCQHFGVVAPALAPMPDSVNGVAVTGEIAGMTVSQRAQLDRALQGWLRESPWYEPTADTRATTTLDGEQSVTFAQAPIRLSAAWTKRVSYQVDVPVEELVVVRYDDQRTWMEPMPRPSYEYEASGTTAAPAKKAPAPAPQKQGTWSIPRVTLRVVPRKITRTVTRFRDEPRVYRYDATARTARYRASWELSLDVGAAPLDLRIDAADRKTGLDHDAAFAPAGIEPSRAGLDSADVWTRRVLLRLAAELPPRLVAQWNASFCAEPTYTAEAAARCARGGAPPAPARAALEQLFGADVDRAVDGFARP
jgi:hypothetical protein